MKDSATTLTFRSFDILFVVVLVMTFACLANAQAGKPIPANSPVTASNANSAGGTTPGTTNENINAPPTGARKRAEKSSPASQEPCPTPNQTPLPSPVVTDAYKEVIEKNGNLSKINKERTVELGDVITVEVSNLKTLLIQQRCTPTGADISQRKNIVLFLDGRPLKNSTAYPPSNTELEPATLKFPLNRTEDTKDVWTYVLGRPRWSSRPTTVSIGLEDSYAVQTEVNGNDKDRLFQLSVIPHGWFAFWTLIFAVLVIGFFMLAIQSDVLRDSAAPSEAGARRPYSLARTQAAWWFFLVIAAYLFIGMITGDFSTTITGTVLGLLGISAGTVVGSAFVDASKSGQTESQRQAFVATAQNQIDAFDAQITSLEATKPMTDPIKAQIKQLQADRDAAQSQLDKLSDKSENFLLDILSDANGVSFHRFQIAAWTLVLGIIFVIQVYKMLAMPIFDGSLLALLGISAGTYLGLKIPEDTVPKKQS